ncbi:MAG: hypothetical protein Q9214_002559 [Letrouitia sp. 1 TL-2023]
MHATIVRIFTLFALPAFIAATCGSCIGDSEVRTISQKWLDSFSTGGPPVRDAATRDILIYDEGATNGSTKPEVTNIKQLEDIISASAYGGGGVTNVTYSIVFTFHTCDRIALRWQEKAITTDNVGYGRYIMPVRSPFQSTIIDLYNAVRSRRESTSNSKAPISSPWT